MDRFRAVTFNVHFSTRPEQVLPVFKDMLDWGASVFFLQEVKQRSLMRALVDDLGLFVMRDSGMNALACVPFEPVSQLGWQPIIMKEVVMSDQPYSKAGGGERTAPGMHGILCDNVGQTLEAVSFHPPAHIQRPNPPARRYRSFIESMETMGVMASDSRATAFLGGCDDNWDYRKERFQNEDYRDYVLGRKTGMREVNSRKPTHGNDVSGRYIDSFWIMRGGRLRPIPSTKTVWDNPSEPRDHNGFGVEWEWII